MTVKVHSTLMTVLRFTVSQKKISRCFGHVTDHPALSSDKMASRKREYGSTSSDGAPSSERWMLLAKSVDKWMAEYDKELNTSIWLKYNVVYRLHVDSLICSVCTQFKSKFEGMCNYNPAFIEGSKNLQTNYFKDHVTSSMHAQATSLLKNSVAMKSPNTLQLQSSYDYGQIIPGDIEMQVRHRLFYRQ